MTILGPTNHIITTLSFVEDVMIFLPAAYLRKSKELKQKYREVELLLEA